MFPDKDDSAPPSGDDQAPGGDAGTPPSDDSSEDSGPRESPFRQGVRDTPPDGGPARHEEPEEGEEPPVEEDQERDQAAAKPPAAPDPVEAEIKALGLKDAAAARFRELSKRPKPEEVTQLKDKAVRFDNWNKVLNDTGSSNQQLSAALGYLGAINSRDPQRMNAAFDSMLAELQWLGGQIGRALPGYVDPLAGHADLKKAVDEGDLTEEFALQIAQSRASDARRAELAKRNEDMTAHNEAVRRAAQTAIDVDVRAINDKYAVSDAHFDTKVKDPKFTRMVQWIYHNVPIERWASAVEEAYLMVPDPAPPKPRSGAMPLRPSGAAGSTKHPEFKNPTEAFRYGVRTARG